MAVTANNKNDKTEIESVRAQNARRVFLIDCIGAIISALMLGLVMPNLERYFGMPRTILYNLAIAAGGLALVSGGCALFIPRRWQILMRVVATINVAYCLVSLVFLIRFWSNLTHLGMAYFISEKFIVLGLAAFEFRVAKAISYARTRSDA